MKTHLTTIIMALGMALALLAATMITPNIAEAQTSYDSPYYDMGEVPERVATSQCLIPAERPMIDVDMTGTIHEVEGGDNIWSIYIDGWCGETIPDGMDASHVCAFSVDIQAATGADYGDAVMICETLPDDRLSLADLGLVPL